MSKNLFGVTLRIKNKNLFVNKFYTFKSLLIKSFILIQMNFNLHFAYSTEKRQFVCAIFNLDKAKSYIIK